MEDTGANKLRQVMIEDYEARRAELEEVKYSAETRPYAIAGIDLLYNFMKRTLAKAGLEPYIKEL